MPKRPNRIHVGASGWSYASWRGPFFPAEVMVKHHLAYYATQFETAELNGVFYRTPSLDVVRGWRDQTPDDSVFAWKASKFITHWKRLSERSVNSLALIEERLAILGPKAGPVLFQLPQRFEADAERLKSFLKLVPKAWRCAFEFRHASWYTEETFDLLHKANVALCISDSSRSLAVACDRASRLCARARAERQVSRQLFRSRAARVGAENSRMAQTAARGLCLFR